MTVTLPNGVQWIAECHPKETHHEHVSIYLIEEDSEYIAIDSGSFYHRDNLKSQIDEVTNGDGLDAILLSHSDYPHSGNISAFRSEWDDVELVASSGSPELQGLADAEHCEIGGTTSVSDRTFHFVDPPLADRSHSTWIFDPDSKTLFTADGFGTLHREGECEQPSTDYEKGLSTADVAGYHEENLVWLRYVDPDKLELAIKRIFDEHDIEVIAPVHGPPILEADIANYIDKLIDSAAEISAAYTP